MMKTAALALAVLMLGQQPAPPAGQQPPPTGQPAAPGAPGGRRPRAAAGAAASGSPIRSTSRSTRAGRRSSTARRSNGWSGDNNWKVEDGAITIESTCEKPTGTVYLVWQGGEARGLRAEARDEGDRQHQRRHPVSRLGRAAAAARRRGRDAVRARLQPAGGSARSCRSTSSAAARCAGGAPGATGAPAAGRGALQGFRTSGNMARVRAARLAARRPMPPAKSSGTCGEPQYDFDADNRYTGQFYEQSTGRGIVAWKGQVVRTEEGKNPRLIATLGEPDGHQLVLQAERVERAPHHRDRQSRTRTS